MAEEKNEKAQQPQAQAIIGSMQYRVSMAEVDAYGVMYYSRFFDLFERGRMELFRALGIEYRQILQQRQILMPVVEAACRYVAPVVYDDLITLETAITNIGTRGIRFDYRILRDDVVLAVGFTQHVFIDQQGRPVSFGKEVIEILKSKGILKEVRQEKKEEDDVASKLKKFVVERTQKGEDN